jgi:hypothetical protein
VAWATSRGDEAPATFSVMLFTSARCRHLHSKPLAAGVALTCGQTVLDISALRTLGRRAHFGVVPEPPCATLCSMTTAADSISDQRLLIDLEPVVERELERHMSTAREWFPHEYVPWSEGEDFSGPLEGREWTPSEERFDDAVRTSLIVNLLTEDNLPSYHFEIATILGRDGAWGQWVGRWTGPA